MSSKNEFYLTLCVALVIIGEEEVMQREGIHKKNK